MSYRAIIADDEKKIIQLIRQLGHWDEYGIEIVDECHDGEEALESILRNKPDFVLSDIKMPVYDGIQLIEKAREQNSNALFILLSGYRYFEYARSAIQLNVVDYLLKPIDEEQLNEILEKVCRRIDQTREQEADSQQLEEYRSADESTRRKEFWDVILSRDTTRARTLFQESVLSEKYQITFPEKCLQIIYVDTNLDGMLVTDNSIFSEKVGRYIENSFGDLANVIYHISYLGHVIILNFAEKDRMQIRNAVSALFYSIRDLNEVYGDFRLNIGCSQIKQRAEELPEAWKEALESEWGRLVFFGNKVLEQEQVRSLSPFNPLNVIGSEEQKQIGDCIAYLRAGELGEIFARIYTRAAAYNNAGSKNMIEVFERLEEIILSSLPDEEQRRKMEVSYYFAYQDARNFQQIFKNIYGILSRYVAEEQEKLKEKLSKPIEEAVRYIQKNYRNAISLEDTAVAANVSPAYLSKIFKEKMGTGFNEYLTQIRLEESKKLLADSNLSVKEIAASVGYADEKYYSKLFKKVTGIKPTDYRRLYG